MGEYSTFNLAVQVEQMRNAQKLYFRQIMMARSTKVSADFATANQTLKVSKQLEAVVDSTITEILTGEREAPHG